MDFRFCSSICLLMVILGGFNFLAAMNNAIIKIDVQVFVSTYIFISLRFKCPLIDMIF